MDVFLKMFWNLRQCCFQEYLSKACSHNHSLSVLFCKPAGEVNKKYFTKTQVFKGMRTANFYFDQFPDFFTFFIHLLDQILKASHKTQSISFLDSFLKYFLWVVYPKFLYNFLISKRKLLVKLSHFPFLQESTSFYCLRMH